MTVLDLTCDKRVSIFELWSIWRASGERVATRLGGGKMGASIFSLGILLTIAITIYTVRKCAVFSSSFLCLVGERLACFRLALMRVNFFSCHTLTASTQRVTLALVSDLGVFRASCSGPPSLRTFDGDVAFA